MVLLDKHLSCTDNQYRITILNALFFNITITKKIKTHHMLVFTLTPSIQTKGLYIKF